MDGNWDLQRLNTGTLCERERSFPPAAEPFKSQHVDTQYIQLKRPCANKRGFCMLYWLSDKKIIHLLFFYPCHCSLLMKVRILSRNENRSTNQKKGNFMFHFSLISQKKISIFCNLEDFCQFGHKILDLVTGYATLFCL